MGLERIKLELWLQFNEFLPWCRWESLVPTYTFMFRLATHKSPV